MRVDAEYLSCPRCGTQLTESQDEIRLRSIDPDGRVQLPAECPNESCETPLQIVILPDVDARSARDAWVEDRRN